MKLNKIWFAVFTTIACLNTANARTIATTPYELETKSLNKDEKIKLRSIQYKEATEIPQQYKGKLKYTEGKEEVYFKDAKMYFGFGGRYSMLQSVDMDSSTTLSSGTSSTYFNKKNTWDFDRNFNFFGSLGVYWRNGVRIELEYSESTFDTNNYASNFASYTGTAGTSNIFNQYLQSSAKQTTGTKSGVSYVSLTGNTLPVVEFSVKTYMLNFIFEKSMAKSKIKPYVGFGVGMVSGDMGSLVNDGSSNVLGAQGMVGLSYAVVPDIANLYLGYRVVASQKMEQTFKRVYGADDFDGKTYTNPKIMDSKEEFNYFTHNIDFGLKFFF